jgi:hypothetical protein
MTKHLTVLVPKFLVNTSSFPQEIAQYGNQFMSQGFEGPPSNHVYGGKNNPNTLERIEITIIYFLVNGVSRLMRKTSFLIKK